MDYTVGITTLWGERVSWGESVQKESLEGQ